MSPGHRLREQIPWPVGSREVKAAAPQPRRSTGVASLRQQPALPGSAVPAECCRVLKALPPSRSEAPGLLGTEPGAPSCLCLGLQWFGISGRRGRRAELLEPRGDGLCSVKGAPEYAFCFECF